MEFDLAIRGGTIADGTGAALFEGDIGIKNGAIAAIGDIGGSAAEEIDASRRVVTPGFVDVHTHYDGQAIWSNELSPSSSHGVTTVVMGNCGVGFAPCRAEDHDMLINVMEGVEDIPGVVMAEGLPWNWETFPDYLDALEAGERDIDVAAFVPHSPLRVYAMGERGANREDATEDDLATMRALTREAMEVGALGFASSRLSIHRTADGDQIPSFEAPVEELKAITAGMTDAGSGTFQMVLDSPFHEWAGETEKLIEIAESCGRPATFSMLPANVGPPGWKDALSQIEAANDRGTAITAQVLPRPIGVLSGLSLTINPFVLCPSFKAVENLPLDEKVSALRDPGLRAKLLSEDPDEGHPLAMLGRSWNWMFPLGDPPEYWPERENSLAVRAERAGVTPEELAYDMMLEDEGRMIFYGALANFYDGSAAATAEMLNHPHCILGLGDGGAHYGTICDASYSTFFLTKWSRDANGNAIPLERAVEMLTRRTARAVGLNDRGTIEVGAKADINVIDLEKLAIHAPRVVQDLPAGGKRLDQKASGYDATIVSGAIIRRHDEATGALPGKLVRGAR